MKLLAFSASNSRNSINRVLVEHAATRYRDELNSDAELEFLDINDFEMPIYSPEREADNGVPAEAKALYSKIGAADALMVSFAEHNGGVTAAWKNILDWMSRIDMQIWQDKPLVLLAASPGPKGGANVLASQEMSAPYFGGDVRGQHGVAAWYEAWDAENRTLTGPEDIEALTKAIAGLA